MATSTLTDCNAAESQVAMIVGRENQRAQPQIPSFFCDPDDLMPTGRECRQKPRHPALLLQFLLSGTLRRLHGKLREYTEVSVGNVHRYELYTTYSMTAAVAPILIALIFSSELNQDLHGYRRNT